MAFTAYEKSDMLMLKMHCTELRLNQSLVYWNITAISILVKFTALKLITHFISVIHFRTPKLVFFHKISTWICTFAHFYKK